MNLTINTDASFCPYTKASGYAVWIVCDIGRIKYSGMLKGSENPMDAELKAIGNALFLLKNSYINNGSIKTIYLNSDCTNALERVKYKSKNDIGRYAHKIAKDILKKGGSNMIQFHKRHVKAHSQKKDSRSFVNEWCDKEAKKWMKKQRLEIESLKKKQCRY